VPLPTLESSLNKKLSLTALTRYLELSLILWNSDFYSAVWAALDLKVHQRFDFLGIQPYHYIFTNFECRNASKTKRPEFRLGCRILIDIFFSIGIPLLRKKLFRCFAMRSCFRCVNDYVFHLRSTPPLFQPICF